MRRAVSFLLALILVLSISMPAAFAAGEEFDFNLTVNGETHTTVAPGGTVEVKLIIVKNNGQNYDLWSAQDYIKFDRAYLTLDQSSIKVMTVMTDGHETDIFEANGVTFDLGDSDRVYVNHAATEGLAVTPTITVVTFNLIAGMQEGTTSLTHDKPEMKSSTRDFLTVKPSDATVTIGQIPSTHTIQASAGTGGTITPAGQASVRHGEDKSFAIAAQSGYTISDVRVDGASVGAVSAYTFRSVSADHSITASFIIEPSPPDGGGGSGGGTPTDKQYPVVVVVPSVGGSLSASVKESPSGAEVTVADTPATGYRLDNLTITDANGHIVPYTLNSNGTYTFIMPKCGVTITAAYVKKPWAPDMTGVSSLLQTQNHIKYINGYSNGTVGPTRNMTRAEAAQLFYNLLLDQNVATTVTFADVPDGQWYSAAVNALATLKIITGYGNGTFGPQDTITREQFCAMAVRFTNLTGIDATAAFSDMDASMWSYDSVMTAASVGWINGYSNGSFGPKDHITRAQVVTIVNHMLGRSADRSFAAMHKNALASFSDLTDDGVWYYYDMVEATNAHTYLLDANGSETWEQIQSN